MVSTVKRFAMAVLSFWFAIWSVLLPVTVHAAVYDAASNIAGSKWYVPAAGTGVAGSRVLATAATALGRANPWIAALTIGTPIMKHILETRGGGEVVIAPTADSLPAPAGWPSSNNPPSNASPLNQGSSVSPISVSPQAKAGWQGGNNLYSTISEAGPAACASTIYYPNFVSASGNQLVCNDAVGNNRTYTLQSFWICPNVPQTMAYASGPTSGPMPQCPSTPQCPEGSTAVNGGCYTSPQCPVGYAWSYDTCILAENATNKVKWPAGTNDGARAYIPDPVNSGQWMPHPRESNPLPQGLSDSDIQSGLINAGQTYTKDAYGNPVATTIIPNLSGGYTFNQQVQTTNNNQTSTTTNTYTTNTQGAVTNVSSVTNNGPITNVSNNYTVDIPNDYNKEATQLKIYTGEGAPDSPQYSQTVTQKVTDMNKSITDLLDPIADQYASDKGKWFSWVWTPPVGQCEPITGSVRGKTVNWDLCPYVAKVRDVIGWIFAIYGAWVIYNEMFRREA